MLNQDIFIEAKTKFQSHFGQSHTGAAYAPGRVEVLGNHTDYNEGFVLSAAINNGTFFLVAPNDGPACRLVAGDLMEETTFDITAIQPTTEHTWSNYVRGVLAGLHDRQPLPHGFLGLFFGNIPLGSGLSSSAALEMCSGLALSALYNHTLDNLTLAKIGQKAEHEFAGVKCGLLDQISSLYGQQGHLVRCDFRDLAVDTVELGDEACFLMCNTHTKHALVDGEYNERREACEAAAAYFQTVLDHPVTALRDVTWEDWEAHQATMDPLTAKRAAHPIGENTRVVQGIAALQGGDLATFGQLMFESHDSSVNYFENSCPELDTIVNTAHRVPGVLGARLSGGGFGGSAVILVHPRDVETAGHAIAAAFETEHGHACDISVISPSDGAFTLDEPSSCQV